MSENARSLTDLMAMGYTRDQCTQALKVAFGDVEQAAGFLMLTDSTRNLFTSQDSFRLTAQDSFRLNEDSFLQSYAPVPTRNALTSHTSRNGAGASRVGAVSVEGPPEMQEMISMGYTSSQAMNALKVSDGDVNQAVAYLLMGESKIGFDCDVVDDCYTPAAPPRADPNRRINALDLQNNPNQIPKMVATAQSLYTIPRGTEAGAFCATVACSKFLKGGTVDSAFLESVLHLGVAMFTQATQQGRAALSMNGWTAESVLEHYGAPMGFLPVPVHMAKHGVFSPNELEQPSSLGIRKLLGECRNEQLGNTWTPLILETSEDCICILLPAKGTTKKFWYIDCKPRTCFRVPGAYARVHFSMMQLVESLEQCLVASTQGDGGGTFNGSFSLYALRLG
jgi:hypothetical protein